jgi:hypothetical protein
MTADRLLAEHRHPVLSRALLLLAGDWRDTDRVCWVNSRRVLAEAWNPRRLAVARERLAAGPKAPAITVVGFHLPPRGTPPIYDPSDGIHRTVAAREAGRRVKARITGYYVVDPQRHQIQESGLWRRAECGLVLIDDPTEEERAALAALGVKA